MKTQFLQHNKRKIPCYTVDTAIVGSGAAGLCAASQLHRQGHENILLITEGMHKGTSRNTGSDKQTYYKLSLAGDDLDSVRLMAEDLFSCGTVDGDNALAEAAESAAAFLNLAALGVPFPMNRFGEYIGYKTDHDNKKRATSAGPLTSKMMTEVLEYDVISKNIPIFDNMLVIDILIGNNQAEGLLLLDLNPPQNTRAAFALVQCAQIVWATGGPAQIYAHNVYPKSQSGSSGTLFMSGAAAQNLVYWQYGIASLNPPWNVSGTYMQVLPRFISVDNDGNEYEFLANSYKNKLEALNAIFKKGYEWPFDSDKIELSSRIDLLVRQECIEKGRRVFLDYQKNPFGFDKIPFEELDSEVYDYLSAADACFGTPIERLLHMNRPAYEHYCDKGIDLANIPLEIALCAQHHNGGAAVDMWWQTSIKGLFVIGEAAGTHGAKRPGGSALNAGQVGAIRAARYIAAKPNNLGDFDEFQKNHIAQIEKQSAFCHNIIGDSNNTSNISALFSEKMSEAAAAVRNPILMKELLKKVDLMINNGDKEIKVSSYSQLASAYKLIDMLICQKVILTAMLDFVDKEQKPSGFITENLLYNSIHYNSAKNNNTEKNDTTKKAIQEVQYLKGEVRIKWRKPRPIPTNYSIYEIEWRAFRENRNIY